MTLHNKKLSILLLAGPTASGKSALALQLAAQINGVIINADSQQVYRELRILTARPTRADEATIPHQLYGHIPASTHYSVGMWIDEVSTAIQAAHTHNQVPILVGGSGMYHRALLEGLANIPPIPAEVREEARQRLEHEGTEAFYRSLILKDPEIAGHIDAHNPHRLLRAWEVITHTGTSLHTWQARTAPPPFLATHYHRFLLLPPREQLYQNANKRVHKMVEEGVLEEVKALLALQLAPDLPAMKSHGVRELQAYFNHEISLEKAIEHTQQVTRHYVKRQHTWFKKYAADFDVITPESGLDAMALRLKQALAIKH